MLTQEVALFQRVEETPKLTMSALVRVLNASSRIMYSLLLVEGLYPYRYTTVQGQCQDNFQRSIDLCEWPLQQHEANDDFTGV